MRNNKKKGFTLIELIAVIAILAILGAILVPNVLGYRKKAMKSNIQTSAKTIVSAMEAYNSDKETAIGGSTHDEYMSALTQLDSDELVKLTNIPSCLGGTKGGITADGHITYPQVQSIAEGNFSINSLNGDSTTLKDIATR